MAGMEKRGVISPDDTPPVYEEQLRIVKNASASGETSDADLDRLADSLVDKVVGMAKPRPSQTIR
jgi:hypothetical protein